MREGIFISEFKNDYSHNFSLTDIYEDLDITVLHGIIISCRCRQNRLANVHYRN